MMDEQQTIERLSAGAGLDTGLANVTDDQLRQLAVHYATLLRGPRPYEHMDSLAKVWKQHPGLLSRLWPMLNAEVDRVHKLRAAGVMVNTFWHEQSEINLQFNNAK
jgi:hypothetical protein